jgi:tetratricopeptide (TPR) repeat protein/S1-C subfamily serine protease
MVWIHGSDGSKGTGWVQDRARRRIVTAGHVVGDGKTVDVFFAGAADDQAHYLEHREQLRREGRVVSGRILRRSSATDLALVQVEAMPDGVTALPLATRPARPGDRVHLAGNRYDTPVLWTYTGGAVLQSQVLPDGYFCSGRQMAKGARVLTAQAPINEGDSGAALLNEAGEVVGVAAAVAWETQGAGLFIDLRHLRDFLGEPPPSEEGKPEAEARSSGREVYRSGVHCLALIDGGDAEGFASGCVIDRDRRLLLTTAEVVGRKETALITFPVYQGGEPVAEASFYKSNEDLLKRKGVRVRACVLHTDQRRNLALLKAEVLPAEARAVVLATAGPMVGDVVHILGNPRRTALRWAYAAGNVRQVGRVNLGLFAESCDATVLLLQAVVGEGEGGGPVLDDSGELAGIMTGKSAPQQQTSYALTRAEIEAFLAETRPLRRPESAADHARRAEVFRKARDYERARRDLAEAICLQPKDAAMQARLGQVLASLGRFDDALAACSEALRLEPGSAEALCVRAEVWCRRGQPEKAIADADAALKSDRTMARAFAIRGLAKLLRGDADGAIADCDEAVWLDRRLAEALFYRGQAYAQQRAYQKAIEDFTSALRLTPQLPDAQHRRGEAHWARGDVPAALEDYTVALAQNPRDAAAACGRARCLAARDDHSAALAAYEEGLRMDPHHGPAWVGRGAERLRRDQIEAACADFKQGLTLQPSLAGDVLAAIEARADAVYSEQDFAACIAVCRAGLEVVKPALADRRDLQREIANGMAVAEAEPEVRRKAALLRRAVKECRQ